MPLNNFFDLGPRGIVIHEYDPGQEDLSLFTFALEGEWRAKRIASPSQSLLGLADGDRLPLAMLPGSRVFVNLNAMVQLDPGQAPAGTATGDDGSESERVILYEGANFFSVPAHAEPISEGFEHDAGVLVNRGAILAAIPGGNLPIGTWCVLINLAQLIRYSKSSGAAR